MNNRLCSNCQESTKPNSLFNLKISVSACKAQLEVKFPLLFPETGYKPFLSYNNTSLENWGKRKPWCSLMNSLGCIPSDLAFLLRSNISGIAGHLVKLT